MNYVDGASIRFGMTEDFKIPFEIGSINSVYAINTRELICTTSRSFNKIEKNEIKLTTTEMKLSASLIIPNTDLFVGIETRTNLLNIFQLSDISKPIVSKYKTNLNGIFHIYFAPRTSSLVLVGYGIKVFYVNIIYDKQTSNIFPPKITVSLRSTFCEDFNTPILSPVPFDPDHELIFIPTSNGIWSYDMDGHQKDLMSSYPASITTLYCYNHFTRKMFTFEPNQGLILWSQGALVDTHFASAGTSIFAIFLVDEENLVCLNGMNQLFLLNFISGRVFFCHSFEKRPSRLFMTKLFNKPYIIVCYGATLRAIKIDIPWKVWNYPLLNCYSIARCDKLHEAGRILVQTNFNAINLYTPSRGSLISSATPNIAVTPISFFYDRGFIQLAKRNDDKYDLFNLQTNTQQFDTTDHTRLKDNNRDIIYFIFDDGTIIGYYTGVSPCEEVINLSLKAHFLLIVNYDDAWCYAAVSEKGLLGIYNYYTFEQITQLNIYPARVLKVFYEPLSQSVICITDHLTVIYNLKTKSVIDQFEITGSTTVSLFGDFLKYGYKSGHVTTLYIKNGHFDHDNIIDNRPHSAQVTGFSFSQENWISASMDCKLLVWNYHEEKLYQVLLPLPLFACCIYNGYKNIIVATESEIMSINTKLMFRNNENEIKEIDNYDRLVDYLDRQLFMDSLLQAESSKESVHSEATNTVPIMSFDVLINEEKEKIEAKALEPPKPKETVKNKTAFNNIDDTKKIEAMMKMNGIKAPVNIMKFANLPTTKKNEESQIQNQPTVKVDQIENKPPTIKNNLTSSSPKDFIKKAIQEEKDENVKKKIRKKKIAQKEGKKEVEEPTKHADLQKTMDLLNQLNTNTQNENLKIRKKSATLNPPKKQIDIAALAKKFGKIEERKEENESDDYIESSSDSEEEDQRKKKKTKKRSNTHSTKPNLQKNKTETQPKNQNKPKSESKPTKIESNTKKVENNYKPTKVDKPIKVSKPHEKPKNEEKPKNNTKKKVNQLLIPPQIKPPNEEEFMKEKPTLKQVDNTNQNKNNKPNEKPIKILNNKPIETSNKAIEKQIEKSNKIANNGKKVEKPLLLNIATQRDESNSEQNEDTELEINQDEIEDEIPKIENPISESTLIELDDNDYNDMNSESDFNDQNDNQILEVRNISNLESSASEFEINNSTQPEENTTKQRKTEVKDKKPKIHYNPGVFQKKFKPTKPIQYPKPQVEFRYRPAKQFTFTINHKGKIEDIRPKRPATPDPDSRNSKSIAVLPKKQIKRCFSYLPKKQRQPIFDFSITNIPANIWIDDNALFEKYSIRRSVNNEQTKSAICLDDRVKRNNSPKQTIRSPSKPRSNFFNRNKRAHNLNEEIEEQTLEQIDDHVQKLQLRYFQLHEYQRSFQYLQTYKQYEEYDEYKKQPNNHSIELTEIKTVPQSSQLTMNQSNSPIQSKSNHILRNQNTIDQNVLYQSLKSLNNSPKNEMKLKIEYDNPTFSIFNQSNSIETKHLNTENEEFEIQPPIKTEKKQTARKSFLKKVSQITNSIRIREPRYDMEMGKSVATIEANETVDKLEEAFMKKMPFFEMKKNKNNSLNQGRSSSARRIAKPKLYLNPVYPPNNRNPTIDSAVIRNSKNHYY